MADGHIPEENSEPNQRQEEASDPARTNNVNSKTPAVGRRPRTLEETLTPGIPDEQLWRLIRRFNKQVSHVQAVPRIRVQQLDLNPAAEEQFPPEKLQRTIERFYTSVIAVLGAFLKQVSRLRSWNEPCRTGAFGAVYLIAWLWDLLIPMIISILVAMILCPPIRSRLFPPLPKTQTYSNTKSDSKPMQSTATSAPQVNEGEEAENEATSLATGITESIIEGSNGQRDHILGGDMTPDSLPSETAGPGNFTSPAEDKAEKPITNTPPAISRTMRILSDVTDLCERMSNLLSPSPPFDLVAPRLRLTGILISVSLVSLLLSSYVIIKTCAFTIGLAFFGDPILRRAVDFLNLHIPNWKEYLDLEKTLLKGVPTNAQLTLTLLRIGEANSAPLPPPPGVHGSQNLWPIWHRRSKMTDTGQKDDRHSAPPKQDQISEEGIRKPKRWLRVLRFARRAITTTIKSHAAFEQAMSIARVGYAHGLLAVLDRRSLIAPALGYLTFEAKFERKRGTVVIDSSGKQPVLYFTAKQAVKMEDIRLECQKASSVGFQIALSEIKGLRKTEGLGWKGKLIVDLTAGGQNSADGLVIQGMEPGQTYHLTGMRARNQLFNRLIAGGTQFWEMH